MSVDRAAVRSKMASSIVQMLAQGVLVEDIIEALRIAVRQTAMQAQSQPNPRRRMELLTFYADTDQILGESCRRIDIAGRSAKNIAGTR